jgi:hypothetical protein
VWRATVDSWAAAGAHEGHVLAGKYRLERVLGIGGMGAVLAAHHLQLDTKVAIKFLLPSMLENSDAVERFANEARRAVKIQSEHVARVYDVGVVQSGAPYIVMEYLQGVDLSALLVQRGPLPIHQAVDFVLQATEAIAEAHALGIVHRDLKPANLFCVRRADGKDWIKVLDFGISKAVAPSGSSGSLSMTATASLMGSPFYMSPEQMEASSAVDARTDIWALGVIVFQLLTGTVPFCGESVPEVCSKIATRPPPRLQEYRSDAPEGLQAVVLTCLEKDRERRYRNVAEMAMALLPYAPRRSKISVERIGDIIRAAGLSATAASERTGQPPHVETIAPLGRTTPDAKGGGVALWFLASVGILGLAAGVAAFRHFVSDWKIGDSGVTPPLPSALEAGAQAPAEVMLWQSCVVDSKRCVASTPQTCSSGQWVSGPVAAGECGAVCTPGSSLPRCRGRTPQSCTSSGQWEDGTACGKRQSCRDGECIAMAQPIQAPVAHSLASRTEEDKPVTVPAASTVPSCRLVKEFDSEGNVHFKQACD